MEETEVSWLKYSKYVLLTIDRLVDAVDKNEQEVSHFREGLVKDLVKLKEEIRKENADSRNDTENAMEKALDKIDDLIRDLSSRTGVLEKQDLDNIVGLKLSDFKDKYVTPVRLKVLVISTMLGMVGGLIAVVVPELLWRWLHG